MLAPRFNCYRLRPSSDNEKVELRAMQFAQTRDSEKLIFGFDL